MAWVSGPTGRAEVSALIRLNTVGYLPQRDKQASIAGACTNFTVVRSSDGVAVLAGRVAGPVLNPDTQEQLFTADFSALTQSGEYQLDVPGVGRSAPFRVAADVYHEPFRAAMRAFYLWRCGTAVNGAYHGQTYAHDACHTNDAWLDYVGGGHRRKAGARGWHDAGDYNKYVVNAGVTVGALFRAWEDFGPQLRRIRLGLPEAGGELPEFLVELQWELDWLLTMQAPDGSVYHKLTTKRFGDFIPPESETAERYFTPWGTEATANFVGMTAQAARVFEPFDHGFAQQCLEAARKSYAFLRAHPEYHKAEQTGFSTGAYEVNQPNHRANGVPRNRLWAAAELWETTGAPSVLRDLEAGIREIEGRLSLDFDWDEVKDLGLLTYLASQRPGRDPALVALVRSNLLAVANDIVQTARVHGYERPLGNVYYWGCNGSVARQTLLLVAAERAAHPKELAGAQIRLAGVRGAELLMRRGDLGGTPARPPRCEGGQEECCQAGGACCADYQDTCLDALNHLFGRNCYGRSFVTGVGFEPPRHPHDRRCGDGTAEPWPGYLVGGAHPRACDWHDVQSDFRTNEIAINWNAALVYALAACLSD